MASTSNNKGLGVANGPVATSEAMVRAVEQLSTAMGGEFPGVESRPGVCGGDPVIVRTRIPIWLLEKARRAGLSQDQILENFPSLRPQDLALAWAYVLSHLAQIDEQIRNNEAA
jgi:uncharacterized protein (DUF433 family)